MKGYSSFQFALFRIVLGAYLALHFAQLIPYAGEMFSAEGVFPDGHMLPTSVFPNILNAFPSASFAAGFLIMMSMLALLLAFGVFRPLVCLLLWYGWACLVNRNPFISNPGLAFVGWLLLAMVLVPRGEGLSLTRAKDEKWQMPPLLYWGALFLMGLGYTTSGLHKLTSPSWLDGSALQHVMSGPLARDYFLPKLLLSLPHVCIQAMTYGSLALEVLALPLLMFPKTRPLAFFSLIGMHIGILSTVNFADLTLGVLRIHVVTYYGEWLCRKASGREIVFFDGECGMCDRFIRLFNAQDADSQLRFAPLQGGTAKVELNLPEDSSLATIRFKSGDQVFVRSAAIIEIFRTLGGLCSLAAFGYLIPRPVRDYLYEQVALRRYSLFPKKSICSMPSATLRQKLCP